MLLSNMAASLRIRCLSKLSQHMVRRGLTYRTLQKDLPVVILQEPGTDMPSLVDCRQGNKIPRVFSDQEMETRLNTLRGVMEEKELEACLFTSYHNINYYNQYVYLSMGRPYGLLVTMDDQTCISSTVDYGYPWRRGYSDNISYTDWQKDNFYKAVKYLMGGRTRMGLEFDHCDITKLEKLKTAIPEGSFKDVGVAAMEKRMVKSKEEIELIRRGTRISELGASEMINSLHENVMEYVCSTKSVSKMVDGVAKEFPDTDLMDTFCWLQSGGYNTDGAHNANTTRKIQNGDIMSLNCFAMVAGYFTAIERTLFLNEVSEGHLNIWNINLEVHRKGLEIVRPGVRCSDVAMELNKICEHYGVMKYRTIGYGHSFGSLCHYYGREAGLELREDVHTVLQPGMVLSMEPMLVIPEGKPGFGGYREHDLLVVTETGAENLTKDFPIGPDELIVRTK